MCLLYNACAFQAHTGNYSVLEIKLQLMLLTLHLFFREEGFIEDEDVRLVELWVRDLNTIGSDFHSFKFNHVEVHSESKLVNSSTSRQCILGQFKK